MKKIFLTLLLGISFLSANTDTVKTSELELFLFKVGFEGLLKDVEVTKDKSVLNSNEIEKVNQKIELIMNEVYKDKRVLLDDSSVNQNTVSNEDLKALKEEIAFLRKEVESLKRKKINTVKKKKTFNSGLKAIVQKELIVYSRPRPSSRQMYTLKKLDAIKISKCDNFGWCKIYNKNQYVKKHWLKFK